MLDSVTHSIKTGRGTESTSMPLNYPPLSRVIHVSNTDKAHECFAQAFLKVMKN